MLRLLRMEMMICWEEEEVVRRLRSSRAHFLLSTHGMMYVSPFDYQYILARCEIGDGDDGRGQGI